MYSKSLPRRKKKNKQMLFLIETNSVRAPDLVINLILFSWHGVPRTTVQHDGRTHFLPLKYRLREKRGMNGKICLSNLVRDDIVCCKLEKLRSKSLQPANIVEQWVRDTCDVSDSVWPWLLKYVLIYRYHLVTCVYMEVGSRGWVGININLEK